MLVYDVTCQKSFDSICDRIRNIEEVSVVIFSLHTTCVQLNAFDYLH